MLKNILFQVHWFLGITAGLVLAIVGFTGGLLSFEDEILEYRNPGVMTVAARADAPLLSPQALAEAVRRARPEPAIATVTVKNDANPAGRSAHARSAQVGFAAAGGEGRGEQRYADPYTGALLGAPRDQEFFRFVRQLHRWLVMPGGNQSIGKQIVGVSTIILIFFALSGLYLRWPRQALDWRAWLKLDLKKRGRSLYWSLHSVFGVYVLVAYLVMSLTGLWWSFDWYRNAASLLLTGKPVPAQAQRGPPPAQAQGGQQAQAGQQQAPGQQQNQRQGGGRGQGGQQGGAPAPAVSLDPAWTGFLAVAERGFATATFTLPRRPGEPVAVRFIPGDAQHERAADQLRLNAETGAVVSHDRFTDKKLGERIYASVFPLHSGAYFGVVGVVLWMVASLLMPLFFVTGWLLYLDRRKKKRLAAAAAREAKPAGAAAPAPGMGATPIGATLVAFASQTGFAESIAWRTAALLRMGGQAVDVRPLGALAGADIGAYRRALLVVSTFGEGEPPDSARAFDRKVLGKHVDLSGLQYALLALGDNAYRRFCGFGHQVDSWLHGNGAARLFDTVEVDNADAGAIRHWQRHVGVLAGKTDLPDWTPPQYQHWTLAGRTHLNPGSVGGPVWLVRLRPPGDEPWEAGDIAEIGALDDAPGAKPVNREYSIASLPADGAVELVVRLAKRPDGGSGIGSGWLIERATIGSQIALRLRANPTFRADNAKDAIFIGNGTGIAGLRSHLKARAARDQKGAWLVFGERHKAHDFLFADEIAAWQRAGVLDRVDLAFSRDQNEKVYVQDRLRASAQELRARVDGGAAIYVCGSLEGMAPGVDAALAEILGQDRLDTLAAAGRYRRDVY